MNRFVKISAFLDELLQTFCSTCFLPSPLTISVMRKKRMKRQRRQLLKPPLQPPPLKNRAKTTWT